MVVAHVAALQPYRRAPRRVHQLLRALKPRHKQKRQRHHLRPLLRPLKVYRNMRVGKLGRHLEQLKPALPVRTPRPKKGHRLLVQVVLKKKGKLLP